MGLSPERPDGRPYPRITRRCVVLLEHITTGRTFNLVEMAREVREKDYPEFRIRRENQFVQIKAERIRDYLSYLKELNFIQASGNHYTLQSFEAPSSDESWVQTLADTAQISLAEKLLGDGSPNSVNKLPDHLEGIRKNLHEDYRVPTVAAVIRKTGVTGTRDEEVLRW